MYVYCENNPVSRIDKTGFSSTEIDTESMISDDSSLEVCGLVVSLGKGWYYRIDNINTPNEHMHVYNKNKRDGWYAQNKDGSPHDKNKNGPGNSPPNSVKKKLKEVADWDWDEKAEQHEKSNQEDDESNSEDATKYLLGAVAVSGTAYLLYRLVRLIPSLIPPLWFTLPANAVIP